MIFVKRACLLVQMILVALILQVGTSLAQVPNHVLVNATGVGGTITIAIDLDIGGTLPAEWVGWVIDRSTIGLCEQPVVQIGPVVPFPSGAQSYFLADHLADPGITYKYRIYAVDNAGERYYLPSYTDFPPPYYQFDFASIFDNGLVVEGTLVDLGWTIGVNVCPDECWGYTSFISSPPAEFDDLAAASATVQIFGQLASNFEGPYVSEVTSWIVVPGCSVVANVETNWGGLKAMYR